MREPENEPYMKSKEHDHFNVTPVKADELEDEVQHEEEKEESEGEQAYLQIKVP